MNNFKRNYTLILILILPLYFLVSCSSDSNLLLSENIQPTPTPSPTPVIISVEFQEWIDNIKHFSPDELKQWWNEEELKNWKYEDWSNLSWEKHKYDTAEEVYFSKLYNCHRMSTVWKFLFGNGTKVYMIKEKDGLIVPHEVIAIKYEEKFFMLSISGPLSVWEIPILSLNDYAGIEGAVYAHFKYVTSVTINPVYRSERKYF